MLWEWERGWQTNQERKKSYKWKQGHQGVLPQRLVRWVISQAMHIIQAEQSPLVSPTYLITQSSHDADSHLPLKCTKRQCTVHYVLKSVILLGNFLTTPVETSAAFNVCVHVRERATKPKQPIICFHNVLPQIHLHRAALSQTQWHHVCWRQRRPLAADPGSLPSDSPGRGSQNCPERRRLSCAICKKTERVRIDS